MKKMNKGYLNRIVAFMMALACVVVWVLPLFSFHVEASSYTILDPCDFNYSVSGTTVTLKTSDYYNYSVTLKDSSSGEYIYTPGYTSSVTFEKSSTYDAYYFLQNYCPGPTSTYGLTGSRLFSMETLLATGITFPDITFSYPITVELDSSMGTTWRAFFDVYFYDSDFNYLDDYMSYDKVVDYKSSYNGYVSITPSQYSSFPENAAYFSCCARVCPLTYQFNTIGESISFTLSSELQISLAYDTLPEQFTPDSRDPLDTVDVSTWDCTTDLSQVTSSGGLAYDYYSCNEYYAMIEYGDTTTASYDADYNISTTDLYKWRFPLIETQEFCEIYGSGTPKAYDISKLWNDSVEYIYVQYDYTIGSAENDISLALQAVAVAVDEYGDQTGSTWVGNDSLDIAQSSSSTVEDSIICNFGDTGSSLIQSWLDISRDAATPVPCPNIMITNFSIVVARPALESEYPEEEPEETEPTTPSDSADLSSVEKGIENVHVSVVSGFATIRTEMAGMEDSILYGFDNVESALADLDVNINAGLDDLGQEIGSDIADLDTSINQGLDDLDSSINAGLDDLDTSINQGLDDLEGTISGDGTEGDELASESDSLKADTDSVSDFEKEQQAVLDSNFETIQKEVDFLRFSKALLFVQDCLNLTFLGIGDVRIIYGFPLFLGMFFFLCNRVPGAVRPIRNERTRELYREEKVIREHYRAITKKMG